MTSESRSAGVDVYLFPAVIGGGLGDIAEVLDAGRRLESAGFPSYLYRPADRPLPPSVDGPWDWPTIRRVETIRPTAPAALTVTPCWGVSAAPARAGPLGRPGPWAQEAAEVQAAYGAGRTLHVSLEEFARTLTSREENLERYREGGVGRPEARRRSTSGTGRAERARWVEAFRRYRALDRPNLLHLLATFEPSATFMAEFPEIVQVGPLWPNVYTPRTGSLRAGTEPSVLWYASPSSSATILPAVLRGLSAVGASVRLGVRSPHLRSAPSDPSVRVELLSPLPTRLWRPRFARADLRLVTGSRSLLEALELGGPFLYFNGVLRSHGRARRHRPEKIRALLRLFHRLGVDGGLIRDLDAFSRGQRVAPIVHRAIGEAAWRSAFPSPARVRAALPEGLGEVLVRVASALARDPENVEALVARERQRTGRPAAVRRFKDRSPIHSP